MNIDTIKRSYIQVLNKEELNRVKVKNTQINYRIVRQTESRKNPGLTHMGIRAIA